MPDHHTTPRPHGPERPGSGTSSVLAYASDLTQRMVGLASPSELARQLSRRRKQIILVGVLATAIWWLIWSVFFRDVLDGEIVIAVGPPGGQYSDIGARLGDRLQREIDPTGKVHAVRVLHTTHGSSDNLDCLTNREADLAIVQANALSTDDDGKGQTHTGILAVAPLYDEMVMVIVRLQDGQPMVSDIRGLRGQRVALGKQGSGMRRTSAQLLRWYGIDAADPLQIVDGDADFSALTTNPAYVAAIVTSGVDNKKLQLLLATGDYDLLPIDLAQAIGEKARFLDMVTMPVGGACLGKRPVPSVAIHTLQTTALLAVRTSDTAGQTRLVTHVLDVLYRGDDPMTMVTQYKMVKEEDALKWNDIPRHPAVAQWADPYASLGVVANIMESLNGFKEMIVALVLIVYFGRFYWRVFKNRETARALQVQQKQLDAFMSQVVAIERDVNNGDDDPLALAAQLSRATQIKFAALDSLTHEELRSDQRFLIFLMQCAQLIEHIRGRQRLHGGFGAGLAPIMASPAGAAGSSPGSASSRSNTRVRTAAAERADSTRASIPVHADPTEQGNGNGHMPDAAPELTDRSRTAEALLVRLMRAGSVGGNGSRTRRRALRRM